MPERSMPSLKGDLRSGIGYPTIDLELSVRSHNLIQKNRIKDVDELVMNLPRLKKARGFGKKVISEIETKLRERGFIA